MLVVRGGWDGHEPVATTDAIVPLLEEQGFAVRVEDGPAVYADADLMAGIDLIVQVMTMSTIEPPQLAGLVAAVRSGTGFAGWHGGIADAYRDAPDYLHLVGGIFAHHARRQETLADDGTDWFQPHTVHITEAGRRHPITEGIQDFELDTEQYWVLSDEYNDVLATVTQVARPFDAWTRPVTSPAIWTRQWGDGRVFVCTPGHSLDVVLDQNVRTIIERGLLWAARTDAAPYAGGMSKHEDGHLHEPTGDWWYNNKTGQAEQGPQSLSIYRDGPFKTREEAERAPELFKERAREWSEDEADGD